MILYFIKTILCSAILLLIYIFLFENEKINRFKRFYLLASMLLSFIIPLITINISNSSIPVIESTSRTENFINKVITAKTFINLQQETDYAKLICFTIYFSISLFLFVRFIKNLRDIFIKIKHSDIVAYQNAELVLIEENVTAHSFFNCIFINKENYESRKIENEILLHELTHARQKHSFDILLIEFIQCFIWFNPVIIFYKKAIRLNHEFLADESVTKIYNPSSYKHLLLASINQNIAQPISSQFNYLITKKRLIMITKTTSFKRALYKQAVLIPLIAFLISLFGTKIYSQETYVGKESQQKLILQGPGASQQLLKEYDSVILNMTENKTLNNGKKSQVINMSKCNPERMAYIYKLMDEEQRDKRNKVIGNNFIAITTAPSKKSPTTSQLASWKDSKTYGVWLDGKRINNNELNNYQPSDITYYWESRLEKNARKNDKFDYQIELYTPAYYKAVYIKNSK